ncbi:hypothetical protein GXW83_15000 [Streptacidiphilus sp. PB12-B1b]|uniref:hypothetical protein n=1 Tax=Streptacidiphilus sp. PB12-B1b TaxID=2705012 RepID=UPI0015FC94D3|nr:hypothetical protein [Streptacidiphilus sp. PB12-B1b]QMU76849.1 hypothetical protein GXW83_15000 [Streptacidiphilus sp. PB12-B1b]
MRSSGLAKGCAALLLTAALGGCGTEHVTSSQAQAQGRTAAGSARPVPEGFCLPPEAQGDSTPAPCISESWQQRTAENHAYASQLPAAPSAEALDQPLAATLRTALQHLVGKPVTQAQLQTVTATATRMTPAAVAVTAFSATDPVDMSVVVEPPAGDCIHGDIVGTSVTTEVTGYLADGGCAPAPQ